MVRINLKHFRILTMVAFRVPTLNQPWVLNAGSTKVLLHFIFSLSALSPIQIFPNNIGDAQTHLGPWLHTDVILLCVHNTPRMCIIQGPVFFRGSNKMCVGFIRHILIGQLGDAQTHLVPWLCTDVIVLCVHYKPRMCIIQGPKFFWAPTIRVRASSDTF